MSINRLRDQPVSFKASFEQSEPVQLLQTVTYDWCQEKGNDLKENIDQLVASIALHCEKSPLYDLLL